MNTIPLSTLSEQRLQLCVIVVALLHLLVIFGITWHYPLTFPENLLNPILEITLATHPSETAPADAKLAAAQHQQPSSMKETDLSPQTLQHADYPAQHIHDLWQPAQPEAQIAAEQQSPEKVTTQQAAEKVPNQPLPEAEANANLLSTEQQPTSTRIASLMAELADQQQQYAQLPRKRTVTAATVAAADAEYLYNWRRHIERIGNLNYPPQARHLGLRGELLLLVGINVDGSLRDVQILQSSGSKILDEGAMRIVKLAAPFLPLPEEMRANTDVLEIIRTWQFQADRWQQSN